MPLSFVSFDCDESSKPLALSHFLKLQKTSIFFNNNYGDNVYIKNVDQVKSSSNTIVLIMKSTIYALLLLACIQMISSLKSMKFRNSFNTKHYASKKLKLPDDFKIPEPKPLSVADGNYAGAISGALAAIVRLGSGIFVLGWKPLSSEKASNNWPGTLGLLRDTSSVLSTCNRPKKPIIIYEYESSPFCRKVREACVMLDLTIEYRPCPGARSGWSDKMSTSTKGKRTVPYMEDETVKMFESDEIINYLFDKCKLYYYLYNKVINK